MAWAKVAVQLVGLIAYELLRDQVLILAMTLGEVRCTPGREAHSVRVTSFTVALRMIHRYAPL